MNEDHFEVYLKCWTVQGSSWKTSDRFMRPFVEH